MQGTMPSPILVADESQLGRCVTALKQTKALAVDTEFMRTDTFYPILGLIQVYDGRDCWLIDPLAFEDLQPLVEVLDDPDITKVFHSCSEDLEVLQHVLGCLPLPVYDTQIAAALAGHGFSKGYAALVSEILGVHVPKDETRSDWLQRPLSEAQLGYAAADVFYLLHVYQQLARELEQLQRGQWMDEEMAALAERAVQRDDLGDYYRKVKGAWRLNQPDLQILKLLCEWRELEARHCNRPRNRVLPDRTLLDIIARKPAGKAALASVEGLHPGIMRRYGDRILELLQEAGDVPQGKLPEPLDAPLPRESKDLGKLLKSVVSARADALQLPVEMLARKRDLEELMRIVGEGDLDLLPPSLANGWRYQVVGEHLLRALAETRS